MTDGRSTLLATVSEKEWQRQVEAWAKRAGWLTYHTWSAMHSPAGFPDLVLVRDERVVFMELKSENGRLSKAQAVWLVALGNGASTESYMFRTTDEADVKRVLGLR